MNSETLTLYTVEEIQKRLGIGRSQAYALVTSGELSAFKIGRSWKITKEALDDYLESKINRKVQK